MQARVLVKSVNENTIILESTDTEAFENNIGKTVSVDVKGQSRSLNANSYFHLLSDKIAEKLHVSKSFSKNTLMSRYGQKERDDNGKQIMLSVVEGIDLLERSDIHCEIKGYGHIDGKTFIHYGLLKPTHTYSVKEMQVLIDGTVTDANELGIETIPPAELERMMKMWKGSKA